MLLKNPTLVFAFAFVLFAGAIRADTVILKNGEKIEGKVIEETDAQVKVAVRVTQSITDERIIKRADVERIEKVKPEDAAWLGLKGLALGDESMDSPEYDRALNSLKAFVTQFPQSSHAAEAKEKIEKFEEEKKRVQGGERKFDGKWIAKEEVEREQVQIAGRVYLARMKRHFAARQWVEAMNTFDAMEKGASGSASFPEAVELARRTVPALRTAAEQREAQLKKQAEDNQRRLDSTKGAELDQLHALLKQQSAAVEAAVTSNERSGAKWMPLNPATPRSISTLINKCTSETSSLNRYQPEKMRQSVRLAESAREPLEAKDYPKAEAALRDAAAAWPNNELVKRLQPRLVEVRKAYTDAKIAEEKAKAEAERIKAEGPPPKPAAAPPTEKETSAEPPAEETSAPKETAFWKSPVFWVSLLIVAGLAFGIKKFVGRFADPTKNILDQ